MYCKKCGKEIPDDSVFYNHCGTRQIPQKVTVEFNKPSINEDDVRKGVLSFFSFIKWLWKVLLLKYWLISIILWALIYGVLYLIDGAHFAIAPAAIVLFCCGVIIVCLYIHNFYKWLYEK